MFLAMEIIKLGKNYLQATDSFAVHSLDSLNPPLTFGNFLVFCLLNGGLAGGKICGGRKT
jgi:hypothetical protein